MFEHFEHKADIGVRGKAPTLKGAFEECARALVEIMVKTSTIEPKKSHIIRISAKDKEALLVLFLNELLFLKDTKKMLYSKFRAEIKETMDKGLELKVVCFGEKINLQKHEIMVEVKAATYSELKVHQVGREWVAQCIVDV